MATLQAAALFAGSSDAINNTNAIARMQGKGLLTGGIGWTAISWRWPENFMQALLAAAGGLAATAPIPQHWLAQFYSAFVGTATETALASADPIVVGSLFVTDAGQVVVNAGSLTAGALATAVGANYVRNCNFGFRFSCIPNDKKALFD
jgi:hypothetical protein